MMQALADQQPRKRLYAIFRQDRYVGLSCAESAVAAIDLYIEVAGDYCPGRVLVGPWMAMTKFELDARSRRAILGGSRGFANPLELAAGRTS